MFEVSIRSVLRKAKPLSVAPGVVVTKAARMMARRRTGAILVMEADALLGIFTERDLLVRVVAAGVDPTSTPIRDVMTANPHTIDADRAYGHALLVMHEKGFRHLPVVDKGQVIGVVSTRTALDPDLEDFASEASRREHLLRGARAGAGGGGGRTPERDSR